MKEYWQMVQYCKKNRKRTKGIETIFKKACNQNGTWLC